VERLRRALRGTDRALAPALPVGEAMHPVALACVIALVVNDWVLKPWLHDALTGKLSDVAGLAFAPLALSAAIGLVLHAAARAGVRVDPSLGWRRLLACIAATALGFTLVKVCPPARELASHVLGHGARFAADWTDLLCLPALAIALWIGRDELRRVPLGRPAAIHRLGRPAGIALLDTLWAGADGDQIGELAVAIECWDVPAIDAWLRER